MKRIILYIAILISIAGWGYSQTAEDDGKNNVIQKRGMREEKPAVGQRSDSTARVVVIIINYQGIGADDKVFIVRLMEKEFKALKKGRIIIPADIRDKAQVRNSHVQCARAACAIEYAGKLKAEFVLFGSIVRIESQQARPLDKNGEYPYLFQVAQGERYLFNMSVYNLKKNIMLGRLTEWSRRAKLNDTVRRMAIHFSQFLPEDAVQEPVTQIRARPDVELSLFASGMLPVGRFFRIIKGGCGPGMNVGLSNLFMKNEIFMLSSRYYCYSHAGSGTISFRLFDIMLLFGMSFPLASKFRLIPLIGGGCQFSYARFNAFLSSTLNRYVNPLISVRLEGDIELVKRFFLFIVPEITVFFEKRKACMYASAHCGFKIVF
jgi:hypothetical protein